MVAQVSLTADAELQLRDTRRRGACTRPSGVTDASPVKDSSTGRTQNAEGPGPRKVMVVDDDTDVSRALAACLDAEGYEVELCEHGRDALERLELGSRPDFIDRKSVV